MISEFELVPYHAVQRPAAGNALVVAPHPDDETLGCGGAICAHVAAGDEVSVAVVTDGAGQGDSHLRLKEALAAAEILGYGAPVFWMRPDRGLDADARLVDAISSAAFEAGARVIYAPSPWEVHPDHVAVSMAVIDAGLRLGGTLEVAFYEVGAPLHPNRLLDLTPYQSRKQKAVRCYASQLAVYPYDRYVEGLNIFRAYTLGPRVTAAEAFLVVSATDLERACRIANTFIAQLRSVAERGASGSEDWDRPLHSVAKDQDDAALTPDVLRLGLQLAAARAGTSPTLKDPCELKRQALARAMGLGSAEHMNDDELCAHAQAVAQARRELDLIRCSRSWRYTAPLRALRRLIRQHPG